MAEKDNRTAKAALGIGTAGAIAAAISLLRNTKAAPPGGEVQIPEELWNLIIAIAGSLNNVDADLDSVIAAIEALSIGGGRGWPENTNSARSFGIQCVAVNTAYQANDMEVPDGMFLAIKSSPLNAVGSIIFVARSRADCLNVNSSWHLALNESISYQVKNASTFYVSSNLAGSLALFSAEQES
jgi:hypothetical protein